MITSSCLLTPQSSHRSAPVTDTSACHTGHTAPPLSSDIVAEIACSEPLVLGTSDCDDGSRRTPPHTGPLPATVPTRIPTWPSKAAATRADGGRHTDRQSLWLHATESPRRAGQARPAGHIWPPDAWPGYGRRGGSDRPATRTLQTVYLVSTRTIPR